MDKGKVSKFLSEKQYVNKAAMTCHIAICSVLVIAYFAEVLKGSRTLAYFGLFAILAIFPMVLELAVYHKDRESRYIRHIMGIGYSVLYVFSIFTTNSVTTFVYAIPMYVVIALFSDVQFCVKIVSGGLLFNILDVIYKAVTAGYIKEEIPDIEIRIAAMFLTGLFVIIITNALQKVNNVKIGEINSEKERAALILSGIIETANGMVGNIEQAVEKMGRLETSVKDMRTSMHEVSEGSNETAESVQNQLEKTGQIQDQIEKVKDATGEINARLEDAGMEVTGGIVKVEHLAEQVQESVKANDLVAARMRQLAVNTARMNHIVDMISGVANRTGMLALNASIEAARVGEAGKGFAVVAQEITNLANQTKSATVDITQLINDILSELAEVESAVEIVTNSSLTYAETTKEVTSGFKKIAQMTQDIDKQAKQMGSAVDKLAIANEGIVESIGSVSATTEEISGYAAETYSACEENRKLAVEISGIVQDLNRYAEALKKKENL